MLSNMGLLSLNSQLVNVIMLLLMASSPPLEYAASYDRKVLEFISYVSINYIQVGQVIVPPEESSLRLV